MPLVGLGLGEPMIVSMPYMTSTGLRQNPSMKRVRSSARLRNSGENVVAAEHDHARDPEEEDVVAGLHDAARIEGVQVALGRVVLRRPAERGMRPEAAAKPGVEHIGVLQQGALPAARAAVQ